MRDDELVTAALAGDTEAFASLMERCRSKVEAVVQRMVPEDAEDLVPEAVLRAYLVVVAPVNSWPHAVSTLPVYVH